MIAGAGPAGAATAISLADFAPELRVGIADAPATDNLRVGETVPPQIKLPLQHLGLWPAFEADRHRPSYRMVSAWGGPELVSNEFLFQTQQVGWRLDRARFDIMMRTAAAARATTIPAKIDTVVREESGWGISLSDGARHSARFVVDATGRGSVVAHAQGVQLETCDQLAGSVMLFDDAPDDGTGPLIGPYLSDFLRGGGEFGATTLSRFYAIHMLLIPGLLAALIGFHLYLVAKLGTTAPPWTKAEERPELLEAEV